MKSENAFSLKVLVFCLIVIGALSTAYYLAVLRGFESISIYLGPLYRGPWSVIFGLGALAVLLLWLLIHVAGRSAIRRSAPVAAARREEKRPAKESVQETLPSPSPAIQMLTILQRQGRLVDFLQEDLAGYSDEQVGAAVRNVHQGCKEALAQHLELKPIMSEEEGAQVTIPPGFDLHAVRLSGNVSGEPPFRGILRHHGWRVVRLELPKQVREQDKDWVVAPAEVEV
jgi:hypothetical protein